MGLSFQVSIISCIIIMAASSEVVSVESIIKEAQGCSVPWQEVTQPQINEWLSTYATAKGTCKEFLLASAFPAVSALMGNATVKIFDGYEERVNLYMLALGGPSTGKTQSHRNCITDPILHHLEGKVGGELVLEDATSKGLFKFFTRSENRVALCAIDECHEWFKEVVGSRGSATAPSMKRLLQCYDGSHWYETKGNTNKRVGVPSASLALSCFTQPDAFLRYMMPRLLASDNGLFDRFLLCLPCSSPVPLAQRMECGRLLNTTHLSSFSKIYERIYGIHNTGDKVEYRLSEESLDGYVRHMGGNPDDAAAPQARGKKDDKNIVRLAAVIHVLFSMIDQALNQRSEEIPTAIGAPTMQAAISLASYFEKQRAILRQCSALGEVQACNSVREEEIQEAVLKHRGPFVTPKRIYRKFSSRTRPDADIVRAEMAKLQEKGLGTVRQVERSYYFYKAIPTAVRADQLTSFGISPEDYAASFNAVDEGLTDAQRFTAEINHPHEEEFDAYKAARA